MYGSGVRVPGREGGGGPEGASLLIRCTGQGSGVPERGREGGGGPVGPHTHHHL